MFAFALFAACSEPTTDPSSNEPEVVDFVTEFPAAPTGGLEWVTPELIVEPQSDVMFCTFDTYTGPTIGLHAQYGWQSPFGHHVTLNETTMSPLDQPDGATVDCSGASTETMVDVQPIMVGGDVSGITLPDGQAAYLSTGTRIIIQSHYVNTTTDRIRVKDAIQFATIPEADVETWVAPFVYVNTDHPIPAGGTLSIDFDCTWDTDVNLLFLGGHMHEWGTAYSVDHTPAGGATSRIYDIPVWDTEYRDAPLYNNYAMGEFPVAAGDTFKTTCSWENDTDDTLAFPEEMCATFGMYYPGKTPWICDATP